MKPFIDFVLQFGSLNGQQIDLISSKGAELELRKDAYFIEAGKVFKQVGFIVDGIIRPNRKAFQRRDEYRYGGNSVVDGKTF